MLHEFEREVCGRPGFRLRNAAIDALAAPNPREVITVLDIFDTLERPALIHCKSGVDRTDSAAALWVIYVDGRPIAEAQNGLSPCHLHLKVSKIGVLDTFLDAFAARPRQGPIEIRDWIETEYDAESV